MTRDEKFRDFWNQGVSTMQIATLFGKSRSWVKQQRRKLELPDRHDREMVRSLKVHVSEDLHMRATTYARSRRLSVSELIRQCLEKEMTK